MSDYVQQKRAFVPAPVTRAAKPLAGSGKLAAQAKTLAAAPKMKVLAAHADRMGAGRAVQAPASRGGVVQAMFRAAASRVTSLPSMGLSVRRFASSPGGSGGGGGGGDDPGRQRRALEEMKRAERERQAQLRDTLARAERERQAQIRETQARAELIRRTSVVTYGRSFGYLRSTPDSLHRATVNDSEDVLRGIDRDGLTSQATREGAPPSDTPPTAHEMTDYSGVMGRAANYQHSRLVGLNADVRHTTKVATATDRAKKKKARAKAIAQGREPPVDGPAYGHLNEVLTDNLELNSVADAFQQTGEAHRYPVTGEFVAHNTILPNNFGHTSVFPLNRRLPGLPLGRPGQVHPDYLANIGRAAGATLKAPQDLDIFTRRHADPANPGRHIEIDQLIPHGPGVRTGGGGATPGREALYERRMARLRKRLAKMAASGVAKK